MIMMILGQVDESSQLKACNIWIFTGELSQNFTETQNFPHITKTYGSGTTW